MLITPVLTIASFNSPLLAYGQHRIFKQPFKRVRSYSISSSIGGDEDDVTITARPSETEKAEEKKVPSEETPLAEDTPLATPAATVEELLSPREDKPFITEKSRS